MLRPPLVAAALAAALAAAAPAPAVPDGRPKTGDPRVDEAKPLRLEVGQILHVCDTGILCPARAPICDDGRIVEWSLDKEGFVFTGKGPGETLCSIEAANGLRQVWRVTVVPRAKP